MGTWQLSPRGNEAAAALYGGSYGTCTTRHRTIPYEPPYITLRAAVRYIIVRYRTCRRTWTYEASYSAVRVAVRRRTSRRMAPYEASYDTVRAAVRLRTMCRTVPYGSSYGAVRRLVRSYCDDLDLYRSKMGLKMTFLGKGFNTFVTSKRLLSWMNSLVDLKIAWFCKCLWTFFTSKWLFSHVYP